MARDYRSTSPETDPGKGSGGRGAGGRKRGMNPMFVGIIIGLLLGIGLALSLAMWLNRANNPFVEKSRPVDALPVIAARPAPPVAAPTPKAEAEKPRFEFYQILPGEKGDKGEKGEKGARADAAPPARSAEPGVRGTPDAKSVARPDARPEIKPASSEVFFLQAGAFQSPTDAENMKAKVAFAGFEAMVRPVNLPDKGTLYRVRLGPFKSLDEVNRIKTSLSQGGIGAAVVKGSD
ncbi:MAG: SPOR domain-containing protein [Betaproteobacteria bacterium]